MRTPTLSSETVHASAVAIGDRAVLIAGRSGKGKSDLALRLIDRGARLVSDDYTIVRRLDGRLVATAPPNIAGKIEVRGVGLLDFPNDEDVRVGLIVDLDRDAERLPEAGETRTLAGIAIPVIALAALESSAPIKVEAALRLFGLDPE
ncbi:MAG: HPr kinase/phosphatase C-terminal domain-containing protein [Sphingomonas sp.]|nr:HPr kinase/phosphatase C-terminal domain-containing protein [Sphingomonas sp.]